MHDNAKRTPQPHSLPFFFANNCGGSQEPRVSRKECTRACRFFFELRTAHLAVRCTFCGHGGCLGPPPFRRPKCAHTVQRFIFRSSVVDCFTTNEMTNASSLLVSDLYLGAVPYLASPSRYIAMLPAKATCIGASSKSYFFTHIRNFT